MSLIPATFAVLSPGDLVVLVFAGLVTAALTVASTEAGLGALLRGGSPDDAPPGLSALRTQALYRRYVFVIVPAVVAGSMTWVRFDDVGPGAAVLVAMTFSGTVFWPDRVPLHLMPLVRALLRFLLPAVGVALVLIPALVSRWEINPGDLVTPLLGAWVIVALGFYLDRRFKLHQPVRLAVYGSQELAARLSNELAINRITDYSVIGFVAPDPLEDPELDVRWLGTLGEIREIVTSRGIDMIALGPDAPRLATFQQIAEKCLDLQVRVVEVNAFYENVLGHVPIGAINSAWFQAIMHPNYSPTSPITKRAVDLLFSVPLLILALPILPLAALAVRLHDGGPMFYRQTRVGESGREFEILKLRTMRVDARELAGIVPKEELITSVGRFLRSTHLDELPQLINVLRGDMTIVGPRPEQPDLVAQLAKEVPYYDRRVAVKPGLTGWAQVRCGYAGSRIGTAWKMCHDLYYLKNRSVLFDILIAIQTIQVVIEAREVELVTPNETFILGQAHPPEAEPAVVPH